MSILSAFQSHLADALLIDREHALTEPAAIMIAAPSIAIEDYPF